MGGKDRMTERSVVTIYIPQSTEGFVPTYPTIAADIRVNFSIKIKITFT